MSTATPEANAAHESAPHTLRRAERRDWSAIIALIRKNPDTLMQTELPRRRDFFVAFDGNKIIGCCALEVYSKRIAEIRSLAVDVGYRGNGVATALIGACLAEAKRRKIHEVFAITGAVGLFEEAGFKPFKEEKYALIKVIDQPAVS